MSERRGISSALRIRQFRLLVSGQLVSNLGDWIDYLALAVLIAYVWNKGPGALAALAVTIAIPWIFVAPFSGVLADRWPKRSAMIGMGMTEKQGGSDVRSNQTRAHALDGAGGRGGAYRLIGHKWFFSAPQCDAHLVLARTDTQEGLSCFFVPRFAPEAARTRCRSSV